MESEERGRGGEKEAYPSCVLIRLQRDMQHLPSLVALLVDELVADG